MYLPLKTFIRIGFLVLFGVGGFIISKLLFYNEAVGIPGYPAHEFEKPFTQSLFMFVGMAFSYPIYRFSKLPDGKEGPHPKRGCKELLAAFWPCVFDLVSSTMSTAGSIFIPSSVSTLIRGVQAVFTAIFAVLFLKTKLQFYQWFCVGMTTFGIILIGVSAILGDSTFQTQDRSQLEKAIGVILCICGNAIAAFQSCLLEFSIGKLYPLEVVGWEGIMGVIIVAIVCGPIIYFIPGSDYCFHDRRCYENLICSLAQIFTDVKIGLLLLVWTFFKGAFNIYVILVIDSTSAVAYSIISCITTLLTWIVALILGAAKVQGGETWVKWSWLQLCGFVFTTLSTLIYNRVIEFKFFRYDNKPAVTDEESQSAPSAKKNPSS